MRRPPQPAATIPSLPEVVGERAVNVIQLETKGKEKIKESEVMPVGRAEVPKVMDIKKAKFKKTRVSEEMSGPPASMETEEEATTSTKRKKRASATRRKITIKDFSLGSKEDPYDLVEDVSSQGPSSPRLSFSICLQRCGGNGPRW